MARKQLPFNYTSIYARTEVHGTVREALLMPQTFARWGKAQLALTPAMGMWSARQWVGSFLQELTGIPWLVYATNLDLADMPRHDPSQLMLPDEWSTDGPLLPLPLWLIALTQEDVQGKDVLQFITQALLPFSFEALPHLGKMR